MRRFNHFTCALLALSWTASLAAQQPTGTIRGRITDNDTQQPIIGASVTVGSRSAVTGTDGRYTLTRVPGGSDLLHVRLIGYAPASQPVMVAAGDTVAIDLALNPSAASLPPILLP